MPRSGKVVVHFDYTCGDSYRAKRLVDLLPRKDRPTLEWRAFSIKERNLREGEPTLLDRTPIDSFSILALAIGKAVPPEGFEDFHDQAFAEIHDADEDLSRDDLLRMAERWGLRRAEFEADQDRWLREVASDHAGAVERGIPGTPTFTFEDATAMYVELNDPPGSAEEAVALWRRVVDAAGAPGSLRLLRRID